MRLDRRLLSAEAPVKPQEAAPMTTVPPLIPPFLKGGFVREDVSAARSSSELPYLLASTAPEVGQFFKLQVDLARPKRGERGWLIVEGTVTRIFGPHRVGAELEDMSGELDLLSGKSVATLTCDASLENPWILSGLLRLKDDDTSGDPDLDGMKLDALLGEAERLSLGRSVDAASALVDRVLRIDPRRPEALLCRVQCEYSQQRWARVEESATTAEELGVRSGELYNLRGAARHFLGRYEDAIRDYEAALAIEPGDAVVHSNRGEAEQCLGRHAEAIAAFDRALAHDPRLVNALFGRGVSRIELGDVRGAIADFGAVIDLSTRHGAARLARGDAHARLDDMLAASADWKVAKELGVREAADRLQEWERKRALLARRKA
jgi:tetratricopeptide (TPR) repeat protein